MFLIIYNGLYIYRGITLEYILTSYRACTLYQYSGVIYLPGYWIQCIYTNVVLFICNPDR